MKSSMHDFSLYLGLFLSEYTERVEDITFALHLLNTEDIVKRDDHLSISGVSTTPRIFPFPFFVYLCFACKSFRVEGDMVG